MQIGSENIQTDIHRQQTLVDNQQTLVDNQQTLVNNQQTALNNQQTLVDNQQPRKKNKYKLVLKILIVTLIISVIIVTIVFNKEIKHFYLELVEWFKHNTLLSVLIIIVIYIVFTILCIPGGLITLLTGYVFVQSTRSMATGVIIAFICIFIGSNLGALSAFLLSKYLFYDYIQLRVQKNNKLKSIQKVITKRQTKAAIILRLCPLIPFNFLNYFFGICKIGTKQMMVANLAMAPGTFLFVFVGASSSNVQQLTETSLNDNIYFIVLTVLATVAVILLLCIIVFKAKKQLEQELKQIEEQDRLNLTEH